MIASIRTVQLSRGLLPNLFSIQGLRIPVLRPIESQLGQSRHGIDRAYLMLSRPMEYVSFPIMNTLHPHRNIISEASSVPRYFDM